MKRRTFFSLLAAAGLGTGRTGQGKSLQFGRGEASPRPAKARSSSVSAAPVLERIGVQLYTLRTRLRQDFQGTLARVAEIGYREVEFAGYFGHTPQQVRTALDRLGLAAPSAHLPLELLRGEFERTLEAAHVMGHRYLIVAWLPEAERRDLDGYRRLAAWFNRAGERAREAGLRLGYHNHDYELAPMEGAVPYDVFLAETEPANVVHQMDVFWLSRGGGRPLDYIARFPGRFHSAHLKDMDAAGRMVDVGRGVLDFRAILRAAGQAGFRHYFVEHDEPPDPFASIRASYAYLKGLEL